VRFAVERVADRRRAVVFRPPRFAVARFAVPRLAVVRFAVVLRRVVDRFAVVFRPPVLRLVVARRRVVLRPPPPLDIEPLIGEGGGGVGLDGIGVGQTEPGSFCADQSVPWSSNNGSSPDNRWERLRDAYRIPLGIASAGTAGGPSCMADMEIVDQDPAAEWRPWEPPLWLIGAGLIAMLLVGLIQSGLVADPRLIGAPTASPTPCVPTAITQVSGASYVWTYCP
jgi:hypothetical protein